jgi:hypothetical protein
MSPLLAECEDSAKDMGASTTQYCRFRGTSKAASTPWSLAFERRSPRNKEQTDVRMGFHAGENIVGTGLEPTGSVGSIFGSLV